MRQSLLIVVLILALAPLGTARAEQDEAFEQVTLRNESGEGSKRKGRRIKGTLNFGATALTFASKKLDLELPYADVRIVHRGNLGTDVDSKWIVITATVDGRLKRFGLRDGKKLGYGGRIEQFQQALDRRLAAGGHAQFGAPVGFTPLVTPDQRLAFAAPEGATVRVVDGIVGDGGLLRTGVLAIESPGVEGAWTLVMRERPGRTACDDFDTERVAELLTEKEGLVELQLEATTVAQCQAASLSARRGGNAVSGHVWINGDRLYALLVEMPPARVAVIGDLLERVVATVRLPLNP